MRHVHLRSGELEATFVPEAGLVASSLTHRGEELLGQREGLDAYVGKDSTFGIPFLHPWANRLADFSYSVGGREVELPRDSPLLHLEEHGLPCHGLGPNALEWEVTSEEPLRAGVDPSADPEWLAAFPFPHRLEVEIALDDGGLTVVTTLIPSGNVGVPLAFGYHPYLCVPGAPRAEWEVDLPVEERLVVDENLIPTGEREPAEFRRGALGDRSLDSGYPMTERPRPFTVSAAGRTLGVEFLEGYTYAQVYAPPAEDVICFEPMTAPADSLRSHDGLRLAAPGEAFTAAFRITVDG
jgi:aldose 1-epimerase